MQPINTHCSNCRLRNLCLTIGLNGQELKQVEKIVKRPRPVQKSQRLYSPGDGFNSVYIVRSGSVKTYITTIAGDQQITNFHLAGDICGLDGVIDDQYCRTAEALETSSVCEIPFHKLETLSRQIKTLQHQLNRVIGKEFVTDQQILLQLGKMNAEQKVAAFLVTIAEKLHTRGFSELEFYLPMTRSDVANYLGMAVETVSRQITNFQDQGLLNVIRKHIEILNMEQLKSIASFGNTAAKKVTLQKA